MQAPNRKKLSPMIAMFALLAQAFTLKGFSKDESNAKAMHQTFGGGGLPIYIPRKHSVMNYRQQQRAAQKRKNAR